MLSAEQTEWLAVGVVVALSVVLLAWIWHVYRHSPFTLAQFPIYMFQRTITRVLWRAHVEGQVPLGPGQGAVIVCNHVGPVDPAFIALACGSMTFLSTAFLRRVAPVLRTAHLRRPLAAARSIERFTDLLGRMVGATGIEPVTPPV